MRRAFLLGSLAVVGAACDIDFEKDFGFFGRRCADTNPCFDGFVCVDEVCIDESGEGEGEREGEGEGDASCNNITNIFDGSLNVDGLAAVPAGVQRISGDLRVSGAGGLTALSSLCEVEGSIEIVGATSLVNAQLLILRSIGLDLDVRANDGLLTLDLPNLSFVGGDLLIGDELVVQPGQGECPAQNDGPCADYAGNPDLESFSMPLLNTVEGAVRVVGNDALDAIEISVATVGKEVLVQRNPLVASITFENLTTVSDLLLIEDNVGLTSIAFPLLTEVAGDGGNPSAPISSFHDFMLLPSGSLWIWTSQLQGVDGTFDYQQPTSIIFDALATVGGTLNLSDILDPEVSFPELTSVNDMNVRNCFDLDPDDDTVGLKKFSAPKLTTVADTDSDGVFVRLNNALESLILGVVDTQSTFTIVDNKALTSVCGLSTLRTVGTLQIDNNATLASLDGLGDLVDITGNYTISKNPLLPQCQVTALQKQTSPATAIPASGENDTAGECGAPVILPACPR